MLLSTSAHQAVRQHGLSMTALEAVASESRIIFFSHFLYLLFSTKIANAFSIRRK